MSRKNVGHSMTCPNCETLRGQLARMREASEKIKADYDYFIKKYEEAKKAKDKRLRDLLYYQFAAHLQQDLPILFKALSQTQDIAAWLKAHDEKVAREVWLEAARAVREHIIYSGPGGHDPEPVQAILAKMLEAKDKQSEGE